MKYQNLISNLSILRKLLLISTSLLCLSSIPLEASFEKAEPRAPLCQGLTLGRQRNQASPQAEEKEKTVNQVSSSPLNICPQQEETTIDKESPLIPPILDHKEATYLKAEPRASLYQVLTLGRQRNQASLQAEEKGKTVNQVSSSLLNICPQQEETTIDKESPLILPVLDHKEATDLYEKLVASLKEIEALKQPEDFYTFSNKLTLLRIEGGPPLCMDHTLALQSFFSRDKYGAPLEKGKNRQGNHSNGALGQIYIKADDYFFDRVTNPLDFMMEKAVFLLSSYLFPDQELIIPSQIAVFYGLQEVKLGDDRKPILGGSSIPGLVQIAERVEGEKLEEVLKSIPLADANEDENLDDSSRSTLASQNYENWFKEHFSSSSYNAFILLSLLMHPADYKADNIMLKKVKNAEGRETYHLVGIDNDMAFADPIIDFYGRSHIGIKNVLYALPLMDEPLDPETLKQISSWDPTLIMIEWLKDLSSYNYQYSSLFKGPLYNHYQEVPVWITGHEDLSFPARFPLKLKPGTALKLYQDLWTLKKLSQATGENGSPLTLHQAFMQLDPLLASYYKWLRDVYKDTLVQQGPKGALKKLEVEYRAETGTLLEELFDKKILDESFRQYLKALPHTKAYLQHRTQPIEEALDEIIEAFDPFNLSPQSLTYALEKLQQSFPKSLERAFAKTPLSHLFKADPSTELLDALFRLFPQRLHEIVEESGLAPLHQAIELNNQRLVSYLLKEGASPNQQINNQEEDNDHCTALDLACEQGNEEIFTILIKDGAHKVHANRALTFYHKLALDSSTHSSFIKLARHHQELNWLLSINQLLPEKGEGVPIQTASLGTRILPHNLFSQVFTEKGEVKAGNALGRHAVGSLTLVLNNLPLTLYFKAYPELPGLEEAVGEFTRRLLGFGAPYAELLRAGNFPILMSQGIQGFTLAHVLKEAPEILHHLDEEALSSLYLATMLVNPEDGKADNYIVQTLPAGKVRLIAIDNDHAFVPAVVRQQKKSFLRSDPVVQVKSILYCLDQFQSPISQAAREKIININAGQMLEGWLEFLRERNALYGELFTEQERLNLLKKDSYIGIPFQEGAITHLYRKIQRMQEALQQHSDITHQRLLKLLEPELAHRYSKGFERPATVLERFQLIDGPFYGKGSSGEPHTFTTSGHILKAMNIPLKESLLSLASQDSSKEKDFRPNKALQELKEILEQHQQTVLIKMGVVDIEYVVNIKYLESLSSDELSQALSQQDFGRILLSDQRAVLELLRGRIFENLILKNAAALTNTMLMTYPQLEGLLSLNLSGCINLSDKIIEALTKEAPHLSYLNLSHLPNLKQVGKVGLIGDEMPLFPYLKILILNDSDIRGIYLKAPVLQMLEAQNCQNLQYLRINASQLEKVALTISSFLNREDLLDMLLQHPNLEDLITEFFEYFNFNSSLTFPIPKDESSVNTDVFKQAQKDYKKAILNNNAENLFTLGMRYYSGDGMKQDEQQAFVCFLLSANQGHAKAQYKLAKMYSNGKGTKRDHNQAFEWTLKSATQGYSPAQQKVGDMYLYGTGVSKDLEQSKIWLLKSINQGNIAAHFTLAEMYEKDYSDESREKMLYWYRKAANLGHVEAQYKLGEIYEKYANNIRTARENDDGGSSLFEDWDEDKGVVSQVAMIGFYIVQDAIKSTRFEKKAMYWYRRAASQGDTYAQDKLKALLDADHG